MRVTSIIAVLDTVRTQWDGNSRRSMQWPLSAMNGMRIIELCGIQPLPCLVQTYKMVRLPFLGAKKHCGTEYT